jgi:hypothetical protein
LSSTSTLVLMAVLASGSLAAESVKVIEADSGWTSQSQSVAAGGTVQADGPISGAASSKNLVLDCAQSGRLAYSCKTKPCTITACSKMPSSDSEVRLIDPPVTFLGSLWDGFMKRRARAPVLLAARAGGSPNDALLLQDDRGIHWGPALRRVLEGSYCFRISYLLDGSEAKTFQIGWDRSVDPEGLAALPGLTPGGYRIEKGSSGSCNPDPEASQAWVVIAPTNRFAELSADWQKAVKWLDELSAGGASPQTVTTARQAVLAGLAEVLESR